jgi:hypothetical protein
LTSYITGDSRIMFRRTIQDRVRTITPFLRLDRDPYLVISEGRLFWMQDAYTTSRYFPYAQTLFGLEFNYIRNAVKVVIDAYNGTADFYVADSSDPIAETYQRIFPGLFKPLAAMRPMNSKPASVAGGIVTATSVSRISFSRTHDQGAATPRGAQKTVGSTPCTRISRLPGRGEPVNAKR